MAGTLTVLRAAGGPIDLAFAAAFLARWPPATHDGASADGALRLAFVRDDLAGAGGVALRASGDGDGDAVEATLAGGATVAQVRRVFGLDLVPSAHAFTPENAAAAAAGARPALFPTVYEAAAWAVLSLRIPAARAAGLRRALIAEHGESVDVDGETHRAFPAPAALLAVDALPGVPAEKLRRLHGVAQAALAGDLDAATLAALPTDETLARLKALRGIGDFYAELILARAIRPDWDLFLTRSGGRLRGGAHARR